MQDTNEEQFIRLKEDIEEISAAASHELRDHLREALQFCQQLHAVPAILPVVQQIEMRIQKTIDYATALRMYAYLAQNTEHAQLINLEEVVQAVVTQYQAAITRRQAVIRWPQGNMPSVYGRRKQLEILFTHLLDNSMKFNASPQPIIQISVNIDPPEIECIVEDNGVGLDEEFAFLITGLFKRALQPGQQVSGSGAGLAFVRKVMENHGGSVMIESEAGNGCKVILRFPMEQQNPQIPLSPNLL